MNCFIVLARPVAAARRCPEQSGHPLPAIEVRPPSDQRERPRQKVAVPPPKSSHNPAGGEIGTFETQEEAEYFMSLAANLRRFRQCDLAVTRRACKCVPMPHDDLLSNSTARVGITARRPALQILEQG